MKKRRKPGWKKRVERGIPAQRVIELGQDGDGPLGWLALRADLESRLRSSGGRPSDPNWDIKRNIPFSSELWAKLLQTAKELSGQGRQVSAGHLAAQLVEQGLAQLTETRDDGVVRTAEARAPYARAAPSAGVAPGSARQVIQRARRAYIEDSVRGRGGMIHGVAEFPVRGVERLFRPVGLPLVEKRPGGAPTTSLLVAGAAGTGKTTLATALAVGLARAREAVALYLTTESVPTELVHKARLLGLPEAGVKPWAGATPAVAGDIVVQHLEIVGGGSAPPSTMDESIDAVWRLVSEDSRRDVPIAVAVIDAFGLFESEHDGVERRRAVVGLIQALEARGITSILVEETLDASRSWLSFAVDLVFELHFERDPEGGPKTRRLSCPKSRYTAALVGPHDYGLEGECPAV